MKNIFFRKIKEENANAVVENVIILPLILLIIIGLIVTCFLLHDRTTAEAAAKRGAIYASKLVSDPNYYFITNNSGNAAGSLDIKEGVSSFSFTGVAKNIKPYRYLESNTENLTSRTKSEVLEIINKTRIPWRSMDVESVKVEQKNLIYYQDIKVTVTVNYKIAPILAIMGLGTEYEYKAVAKMSVNDPDEFIRNTDLIVDLVTTLDSKLTGGKLSNITEKISSLTTKVLDWMDS